MGYAKSLVEAGTIRSTNINKIVEYIFCKILVDFSFSAAWNVGNQQRMYSAIEHVVLWTNGVGDILFSDKPYWWVFLDSWTNKNQRILKQPGGPGTGPWLLKNSCFAVAPAQFHVGNNHKKKNIRFTVVCNLYRVLCLKTRRRIKVAFSLHRMRDLTASPVAVSKSKPVCSHLHWWLRMYLNNKPLRLPWTWERMLSGIDFCITFQ